MEVCRSQFDQLKCGCPNIIIMAHGVTIVGVPI